VREPLAVGRVGDVSVAPGAIGYLPEVALFDGRCEYLAVDREGYAARVGREVVVVNLGVEVADFREALLGLGVDVEAKERDALRRNVQLRDAEVVLEDDYLPVGAYR